MSPPLSVVYPTADTVLDLGIVGVVVELSLFRCFGFKVEEVVDDDVVDDSV